MNRVLAAGFVALVSASLACGGGESSQPPLTPIEPPPVVVPDPLPAEPPSATACTRGATECEGANKVKTCVAGRWKVTENCKDKNQVCSFGAQVENGVMGPMRAFCSVADHAF